MAANIDELNEKARRGLEALTELLVQGAADYAPAPDDRRPFLVGWGLLASLHRQACAVVLLHRKGFGHEAAPNRRLTIEYVAHLQWLVRDGEDAVDCMNKAFQHKQSKLRAAADTAGFQHDTDVAAAADAVQAAVIPGNSANQYIAMSKLLDRLGNGLSAVWLGETQLSHPTLTGARCFFDDSSSQAVQLHDSPRYGISDDPNEASPFVAFMFLYFGMQAFNDLMVGFPWKAALDRIGTEGGLTDAST